MSVTYVYFIQSGEGGPIKVGVSNGLQSRLETLQGGNPVELKLLAAVRGNQKTERFIHLRYAQGLIRGEWFRRDTPGLANLISDIAIPPEGLGDPGAAEAEWETVCRCGFRVEPELVAKAHRQCLWCLVQIHSPQDWGEYALLQAKARLSGGGGNRTRGAFPTQRELTAVALSPAKGSGS